MLVLTRKIDEAIMIGDDIKITILGIEGNQVKVGVDAPKNVPLHRMEIYLEIKKVNEETLQSGSSDLEEIRSFLDSLKKDE